MLAPIWCHFAVGPSYSYKQSTGDSLFLPAFLVASKSVVLVVHAILHADNVKKSRQSQVSENFRELDECMLRFGTSDRTLGSQAPLFQRWRSHCCCSWEGPRRARYRRSHRTSLGTLLLCECARVCMCFQSTIMHSLHADSIVLCM